MEEFEENNKTNLPIENRFHSDSFGILIYTEKEKNRYIMVSYKL